MKREEKLELKKQSKNKIKNINKKYI